jgi:hypothetical protein
MTLDEFRRLADARGGDIARWPPAVRAEATALAQDKEAAAILAEARELDRLTALAAPQVGQDRTDDAIHAVIMRLAEADERPWRPSLTALARWVMPAASFACAAAIGVYLGFAYPVERPTTTSEAQAALMLLLDPDSTAADWTTQ